MVKFIKSTMTLSWLIILLIFITSTTKVFAQSDENIPMVDFKQFEPMLHKSNDTTYVINFWATWCVPCRKELPEFQKLHENTSGEKIKILLVSLDFPKQIKTALLPFLEKNEITAPVILLNDPNSNAWIDKVDPKWTGSLPATLIYKGEAKQFFEEELDYKMLVQTIDKITIKN
jgi:thiol-disulfide isomerase/thioredoxin